MGNGILQSISENLQFLLVCAVVIAVIIGVSELFERTVLAKSMVRVRRAQYVTVCGMLGAIAAVLYLFDFSVAFLAPGFYKLDFSEVPVMVGAFYLGPVGGVVVELVKTLLKLAIRGTSTAFVGELANFAVGCSFLLPASCVYLFHKTKKSALIGSIAGTLCMTVFGTAFNAVYLLPKFAQLFGMPLDAIIGMGTAVNPAIDSITTLVIFAVAPLNLLKGGLVSVITMLIYKKISPSIKEGTKKQGR